MQGAQQVTETEQENAGPRYDFDEQVRLFQWKLEEEERLRRKIERECWW